MKWFVRIMLLLAGGVASVQSADLTRTPVLAELFTSEGCSSCPPADQLLQRLEELQPVANAQVIVLSEHVDYWDQLGWKDPFSAHQFTERQELYARNHGLDGAYTPQLILDGAEQLVGGDQRGIVSGIAHAVRAPKIPVRIISAVRQGTTALIEVESGASAQNLEIWVALAGDRYSTQVRRGENGGKTLTHVSVAHALVKAGSTRKDSTANVSVRIPLQSAWTANLRAIAFLQEPVQGRIHGAGQRELDR